MLKSGQYYRGWQIDKARHGLWIGTCGSCRVSANTPDELQEAIDLDVDYWGAPDMREINRQDGRSVGVVVVCIALIAILSYLFFR